MNSEADKYLRDLYESVDATLDQPGLDPYQGEHQQNIYQGQQNTYQALHGNHQDQQNVYQGQPDIYQYSELGYMRQDPLLLDEQTAASVGVPANGTLETPNWLTGSAGAFTPFPQPLPQHQQLQQSQQYSDDILTTGGTVLPENISQSAVTTPQYGLMQAMPFQGFPRGLPPSHPSMSNHLNPYFLATQVLAPERPASQNMTFSSEPTLGTAVSSSAFTSLPRQQPFTTGWQQETGFAGDAGAPDTGSRMTTFGQADLYGNLTQSQPLVGNWRVGRETTYLTGVERSIATFCRANRIGSQISIILPVEVSMSSNNTSVDGWVRNTHTTKWSLLRSYGGEIVPLVSKYTMTRRSESPDGPAHAIFVKVDDQAVATIDLHGQRYSSLNLPDNVRTPYAVRQMISQGKNPFSQTNNYRPGNDDMTLLAEVALEDVRSIMRGVDPFLQLKSTVGPI